MPNAASIPTVLTIKAMGNRSTISCAPSSDTPAVLTPDSVLYSRYPEW